MNSYDFTRRMFMIGAGNLILFSGFISSKVNARPAFSENPFTLGVASGDPQYDGFVIWTKLAPKPLEEHHGMEMVIVPVKWEVSEDEEFSKIVATGEEMARPELGHAVHVEVAGLLPHRPYYYRFYIEGGEKSRVGKCRTTPIYGGNIDKVRIGVAGCQHYEWGFYTAYRYLSQEEDLDAIFHYGDYIYERRAQFSCKPESKGACTRTHIGDQLYSLDDYRRRYAQYKLDPDLQAAHTAAAFLSSYDDHEISNNWNGEWDEKGVPNEVFLLRRFAALQAWYENMPVRKGAFPSKGAIQMFRNIDYGNLLKIQILDTRQYRTRHRCAGKDKYCRPIEDKGYETIIGDRQEKWIANNFNRSKQDNIKWNLLAQQVMMMPFNYTNERSSGAINVDSWSGYPQSRQRVIDLINERRLTNVVVATGDVHKHHAGLIPAKEGDLQGKIAATEFVGTSISSGGNGTEFPVGWEKIIAQNPNNLFISDKRGYQIFTITPKKWITDIKTVDKVESEGGKLTTAASFALTPEKVELHKA